MNSARDLMAAVAREPQATDASVSDESDIRASLGGDGEAYARLIGRYQQRVAAYLWPLVRRPDLMDEVVHETFVEAYQSLPRFEGRSQFATWLCTIGARVVYRRLRQEKRIRRRERESVRPETIDGAGTQELSISDIWRWVDKLSARDQVVLGLLYAQSMSVAEVATALGWSQTLVKVQAHRARIRLKKLMEGVGNAV
jgi:RNA polymerase sigma-70 factor (ECF subfamily)